jgi:hypothetical protein
LRIERSADSACDSGGVLESSKEARAGDGGAGEAVARAAAMLRALLSACALAGHEGFEWSGSACGAAGAEGRRMSSASAFATMHPSNQDVQSDQVTSIDPS